MKIRMIYTSAAALLTLALAGCSTTGASPDRTRFEVEAATVLLIEQSSRPAARAGEIVESIDRLQSLLTDQTTTVGDLRGALLRRVAERDLTPGEKALALQIVSRIAESVESKVGAGFLSPDAIVSLNAVLGWAENMAALYVAK